MQQQQGQFDMGQCVFCAGKLYARKQLRILFPCNHAAHYECYSQAQEVFRVKCVKCEQDLKAESPDNRPDPRVRLAVEEMLREEASAERLKHTQEGTFASSHR